MHHLLISCILFNSHHYVQNSQSNLLNNSSFEILLADNKSCCWDFFCEKGATVQIVNQAYSGKKALLLSSTNKATAGANQKHIPPTQQLAAIPLVRGIVKFWYTAISSEMEGMNLNLFVIPLNSKLREEGTRAKFTVPKIYIADNKWHEGEIRYDFSKAVARYVIIAPRVNESDYKGAGEWIIDDIKLSKIGPRIDILSFGPSKVYYNVRKKGALTIKLQNNGDESAKDIKIRLTSHHSMVIVEPQVFKIANIAPGDVKQLETKLAFKAEGISSVDLEIVFGKVKISKSIPLVASATNFTRKIWGNNQIRLKFLDTKLGLPLYFIEGFDGQNWQSVGIGYSFISIDFLNDSLAARTDFEIPDNIQIGDTLLILSDERLRCEFKLIPNTGLVDIKMRYIAPKNYKLLNFSGIIFFWGEGSFGQNKTDGLFPGLEWLVGNESSSDTFDVISKYKDRFMPHPGKITIPLMALRTPTLGKDNNKFLVSLLWDANQKWNKDYAIPTATFASPNFLQNQQNHLMSLSLPSIPDFKSENNQGNAQPFHIDSGDSLILSAKILIKPNADILTSVDQWLQNYGGLPAPTKLPITIDEAIKLSNEPLLSILWNEEKQGWHHSLTDIWPPSLDPVIIKLLAVTYQITIDTVLKNKIQYRLGKVSKLSYLKDLDLAFNRGRISEGLKSEQFLVNEILSKQKSDGAWYFEPTKEQILLNKVSDPAIKNTALGVNAFNAYRILRYARVTGDTIVEKAGMSAIRFLDSIFIDEFAVPRGAQLWEVPIHCPDLLAAAHAILAYLEAFRITNEVHYLNRATYWARAGLPFIYLWKSSQDEIMVFGSIPVFGASWFTSPWFGKLVQWNGLEYAYALICLSQLDGSFDWLKIARGVTNCSIQQQLWVKEIIPEHTGLYPDAFDVIEQEPSYQWDLAPMLILKNLLSLQGLVQEISTQKIESSNKTHLPIIIASATPINSASLDETNSIRVRLEKPIGDVSYLLITNIKSFEKIVVNQERLKRTLDLQKVNEGWQFKPQVGQLFMKVKRFNPLLMRISNVTLLNKAGIYPLTWNFDFDGDAEGWRPVNGINKFEIKNKRIHILTNGNDPYIISANYDIAADRFKTIEIKMKTKTQDKFQFFWMTKNDSCFSETNSIFFDVYPDNNFVTYQLNLDKQPQWKQIIKQLRLDLGTKPTFLIEIDEIRLK